MTHLLVLHGTWIFARAGGGGSSSGGGGSIIILLGYLPMHLVGAKCRRLQKSHPDLFDVLQIFAWILTVVFAVLLVLFLRGFGIIAAIGAFMGMGAGLYGWFGKLKQSKKTKAELAAAAAKDNAWNEDKLLATASQVFLRYQQDWSAYNTEAMKTYMTPRYQYHAALMVYALQLAGRQNVIENPQVTQAMVVDVTDAAEDSDDMVTVGLSATATDNIIDTRNNAILHTDQQPFTEFWQFRRSNSGWLLDGIQQATGASWRHNQPLEQFAAANGYYFSLDWGWLLLPARGQLFGEGKFGTSDINNHVIGVYNRQLLIQLYTYVPNPQSASKSYLVAQAYVPKNYGDIVVRRKKGLHLFGIRGLNEVSTEWPDFNKKYEVYATNLEQATSLELLNPRYMEQLEAVPFEVNIEVVDNVVYLYAPENAVIDPMHYQIMLGLLQSAFKEMRM